MLPKPARLIRCDRPDKYIRLPFAWKLKNIPYSTLNQKKEIHKQVLQELVDVMERQRKYFISELRLAAGSGFGEEDESPRYTCNLKRQFHGKTDAGRPMKGKGNI